MFHFVHHEVKIWLESIQLLRRYACVKKSFGVNISLCIYLSRFGLPLQVTVCRMLWDRCPVCMSVCNVCVLSQNGWMDQEATEVGLGPGDIVLDGNPAPPRKRKEQPPTFPSISIVAKWSSISATAELLFYCWGYGSQLGADFNAMWIKWRIFAMIGELSGSSW